MAVQIGFIKPSNDVIQGQDNGFIEFLKPYTGATLTYMIPGRLVKRDGSNTDYNIVTAGAGDKPVGWIGYARTMANFKPADRNTAFALSPVDSNEPEIPVHMGTGFRVRAWLNNDRSYGTVTKGDPVQVAANGTVIAACDSSGNLLANAIIIAYAEETLDNTGGDAPAELWVRSLI